MEVVDHLVHKYGEILCSVHQGGHPASHHGPPVGEGHGESPQIQGEDFSGLTRISSTSLFNFEGGAKVINFLPSKHLFDFAILTCANRMRVHFRS